MLSSQINAICQDSHGFMWFGSDIGLSKSDGYTIYNYQLNTLASNSLSNYFITYILEDTIPGNLWVGTLDGLNYYDCSKDAFTEFSLDSIVEAGGVSTNIRTLFWDEQNQLWIGTSNGVVCIHPNKKASVLFDSEMSGAASPFYINAIEYWKNDLYFISTSHGLYTFNKKDYSYDRVINKDILSSLKDSNQNLWFGTRSAGLLFLPAGAESAYEQFTPENSELNSGHITSIVEDSLGQIWITEREYGISVINPSNNEWIFLKSSLYNQKGIKSNVNTTLYVDRQKNVWIGSYDAGIYFLDNNNKAFRLFQFNYSENDLKNNKVRSMYQDNDGDIWIGTKVDGCLSKFNRNKGTFEHFENEANNPNSLSDWYVFSITELKPGYILVGTLNGGLNLLDKTTGKFKHFPHDPHDPNSLSNDATYVLHKDSKGRIWAGSGWTGLDVFNESMTKLYSYNHNLEDPYSLLGNRVRSIMEDGEHTIWIGTESGLNRYNESQKNFKRFYAFENDSSSLSHRKVSCIYEDTKGRFWVSTLGGGLNLMDRDNDSFIHYTEKDGLSSNMVHGIVEDDSGNLWLSTANGISKFILPDADIKIPKSNFRNYTVEDGLQGKEFNPNAFLKTQNGEILFGGNHGFNIFKPEAIKDNQNKPYVHFTDFKLFNKPVEIGAPNSPLKKHINTIQELTLNHKQSIFSIAFVAINYSSPEKNQYAYKMEGLDDDWNYVGKNREATYRNLKAGSYVFKVKASNNDGLWNEEGTSLKIKILPPFWLSWWAYTIYTIALISLILYLRHNSLKKIQEEKEHELNQLKLKFFINISHEFRTPLTLILNPLDKLSSKSDPQLIDKSLRSIKRNTHQLLRLVNQLLDHRKTELGMLAMHTERTDIVKFTKDIFILYEEIAQSKHINLGFECKMDALEIMVDRDKYEKILHNLLSNAIKFTTQGTISIQIAKRSNISKKEHFTVFKKKKRADYVEITVRDTGVGLSKQQIKNIFDRFYQVDETKTGTGLGLNFVKSLVELHGGDIRVESVENKGSAFIVSLPCTDELCKNNSRTVNSTNLEKHVFSHNDIESLTSYGESWDESDDEPGDKQLNEATMAKKQALLLIVEDNRELRNQIKDRFRTSFRVQEAKNGEEGWQKTLKYYPDVIISDIVMPVMDGIELCKKVKSNLKTCHIPVILLTAKSLVQNKIDGYKTGADEYISKPFNMQLLMVRVKNIIESRRKMKEKFTSSRILLPAKEFTTNNLDEEFLDKVSAVILKNITNPNFDHQILADKLGLSRSSLYKKIYVLTGDNPSKFIRNIKLKYAAELLLSEKYSVKEICYNTGFKSPSYFSKSFRELFQMTPVEYVESQSSRH